MIAVPLEVPLRTLAPNRLVWIQRGGLVYPYPAGIVRDIANDLYVSDEDWAPTEFDIERGLLLADHAARGTNRAEIDQLAACVWLRADFNVWWDSVDTTEDAGVIGAATSYQLRNSQRPHVESIQAPLHD